MGNFRLFVYGLWFGAIFLFLMFIGEILFPGSLAGTASTDLGILSVFAVLILDSMFSLGSAQK